MNMRPVEAIFVVAACVVVLTIGLVLGVTFTTLEVEDSNEAFFSITNSIGEDLNITVFVLDGNDWDEIPIALNNNTTIPLVITWHGEGRVNVHIVYDNWEGNERVLRYRVEDGEYRVVVLR